MSSDQPSPFGDQSNYPENPFASPTAVDHPSQMEPTRTGELTLNPWLSIWTKPKMTIRQIVDSDPTYQIPVLASLNGIASALGNAQNAVQQEISLLPFLAICVVLGPLGGFLMVYLYGLIIGVCCRMLGGVARGPEMRAAIAWSWVPGIFLLPFTLVMAVIAFQLDFVNPGPNEMTYFAALMLGVPIGIWSFIILLNTLAEVNLFSRWKAFFAMMIPGLVVFAVMMVVMVAVFAGMAANGGFAP